MKSSALNLVRSPALWYRRSDRSRLPHASSRDTAMLTEQQSVQRDLLPAGVTWMTLAGAALFAGGLVLFPIVSLISASAWRSVPLFIAGVGLLSLGEAYRRAKPYFGNGGT